MVSVYSVVVVFYRPCSALCPAPVRLFRSDRVALLSAAVPVVPADRRRVGPPRTPTAAAAHHGGQGGRGERGQQGAARGNEGQWGASGGNRGQQGGNRGPHGAMGGNTG